MAKKLFKRGVSPIISTILLIALAVSIGAAIMSLGGAFYEDARSRGIGCSEVLINAFKLDEMSQCQNYEFKSILNFYRTDETVIAPACYKEVTAGNANICVTPETLLNFTWAPIKNLIR